MDRMMRFLGLPGKSFVPLIVGFGCGVPAIMAARTMEKKSDRITTVMMAPFMSCGARLPVYVLFATTFWPLRRTEPGLLSVSDRYFGGDSHGLHSEENRAERRGGSFRDGNSSVPHADP